MAIPAHVYVQTIDSRRRINRRQLIVREEIHGAALRNAGPRRQVANGEVDGGQANSRTITASGGRDCTYKRENQRRALPI